MLEASPCPLYRFIDEPPLNRIAVHIAQLLDSLAGREDVEVVVSRLPERTLHRLHRNGELQSLKCFGQRSFSTRSGAGERAPASRHNRQPQSDIGLSWFQGIARRDPVRLGSRGMVAGGSN